MNVLDPATWDDEEDFLERFGKGMPTAEQVQELQVSPSVCAAQGHTVHSPDTARAGTMAADQSAAWPNVRDKVGTPSMRCLIREGSPGCEQHLEGLAQRRRFKHDPMTWAGQRQDVGAA